MSYTDQIVARFGGTRPMASALSEVLRPHRGPDFAFPPSTVQSWKKAGAIPVNHQSLVIEAGRVKGIRLTREDFPLPGVAYRVPKRKRAA